jgi:carotenoid 1,2-hydratase
MTERGRGALARDASRLAIGPSALEWDGDALTVAIDEVAAPIPSRVRGRVRLHPAALADRGYALDAAGRHRWRPIAAVARAEVALERPALCWSGRAYFDTNAGDAPLEEDFSRWDWCRAPLRLGAAVLYNVARRDGSALSLALRVDSAGGIREAEPPPRASLPRTLWRVERPTRADAGHAPRVVQTLEDAPFYARSVIATRLFGEPATAVHESLSLDRFRAPWVQAMLPFRIPRAWR